MKKKEIPPLRQIRLATNLGRNEFAARLGVSFETIKQIEAGNLSSPPVAARVAKIYGVRPDSLKTGPATDYDDRSYDADSFRNWRARAEFSDERLRGAGKMLVGILEDFFTVAIARKRGPAALMIVADDVSSLARNFGRPFQNELQQRLHSRMPKNFDGSRARAFRVYVESIFGSRAGFEKKLKRAVENLVRPAPHAGPGSRSASKRIKDVARASRGKERRRTSTKVIQPLSREIRSLRDGSVIELDAPLVDLRGVISIKRPIK
jgi:transcriptional regulator with XRE-family HTH domain